MATITFTPGVIGQPAPSNETPESPVKPEAHPQVELASTLEQAPDPKLISLQSKVLQVLAQNPQEPQFAVRGLDSLNQALYLVECLRMRFGDQFKYAYRSDNLGISILVYKDDPTFVLLPGWEELAQLRESGIEAQLSQSQQLALQALQATRAKAQSGTLLRFAKAAGKFVAQTSVGFIPVVGYGVSSLMAMRQRMSEVGHYTSWHGLREQDFSWGLTIQEGRDKNGVYSLSCIDLGGDQQDVPAQVYWARQYELNQRDFSYDGSARQLVAAVANVNLGLATKVVMRFLSNPGLYAEFLQLVDSDLPAHNQLFVNGKQLNPVTLADVVHKLIVLAQQPDTTALNYLIGASAVKALASATIKQDSTIPTEIKTTRRLSTQAMLQSFLGGVFGGTGAMMQIAGLVGGQGVALGSMALEALTRPTGTLANAYARVLRTLSRRELKQGLTDEDIGKVWRQELMSTGGLMLVGVASYLLGSQLASAQLVQYQLSSIGGENAVNRFMSGTGVKNMVRFAVALMGGAVAGTVAAQRQDLTLNEAVNRAITYGSQVFAGSSLVGAYDAITAATGRGGQLDMFASAKEQLDQMRESAVEYLGQVAQLPTTPALEQEVATQQLSGGGVNKTPFGRGGAESANGFDEEAAFLRGQAASATNNESAIVGGRSEEEVVEIWVDMPDETVSAEDLVVPPVVAQADQSQPQAYSVASFPVVPTEPSLGAKTSVDEGPNLQASWSEVAKTLKVGSQITFTDSTGATRNVIVKPGDTITGIVGTSNPAKLVEVIQANSQAFSLTDGQDPNYEWSGQSGSQPATETTNAPASVAASDSTPANAVSAPVVAPASSADNSNPLARMVTSDTGEQVSLAQVARTLKAGATLNVEGKQVVVQPGQTLSEIVGGSGLQDQQEMVQIIQQNPGAFSLLDEGGRVGTALAEVPARGIELPVGSVIPSDTPASGGAVETEDSTDSVGSTSLEAASLQSSSDGIDLTPPPPAAEPPAQADPPHQNLPPTLANLNLADWDSDTWADMPKRAALVAELVGVAAQLDNPGGINSAVLGGISAEELAAIQSLTEAQIRQSGGIEPALRALGLSASEAYQVKTLFLHGATVEIILNEARAAGVGGPSSVTIQPQEVNSLDAWAQQAGNGEGRQERNFIVSYIRLILSVLDPDGDGKWNIEILERFKKAFDIPQDRDITNRDIVRAATAAYVANQLDPNNTIPDIIFSAIANPNSAECLLINAAFHEAQNSRPELFNRDGQGTLAYAGAAQALGEDMGRAPGVGAETRPFWGIARDVLAQIMQGQSERRVQLFGTDFLRQLEVGYSFNSATGSYSVTPPAGYQVELMRFYRATGRLDPNNPDLLILFQTNVFPGFAGDAGTVSYLVVTSNDPNTPTRYIFDSSHNMIGVWVNYEDNPSPVWLSKGVGAVDSGKYIIPNGARITPEELKEKSEAEIYALFTGTSSQVEETGGGSGQGGSTGQGDQPVSSTPPAPAAGEEAEATPEATSESTAEPEATAEVTPTAIPQSTQVASATAVPPTSTPEPATATQTVTPTVTNTPVPTEAPSATPTATVTNTVVPTNTTSTTVTSTPEPSSAPTSTATTTLEPTATQPAEVTPEATAEVPTELHPVTRIKYYADAGPLEVFVGPNNTAWVDKDGTKTQVGYYIEFDHDDTVGNSGDVMLLVAQSDGSYIAQARTGGDLGEVRVENGNIIHTPRESVGVEYIFHPDDGSVETRLTIDGNVYTYAGRTNYGKRGFIDSDGYSGHPVVFVWGAGIHNVYSVGERNTLSLVEDTFIAFPPTRVNEGQVDDPIYTNGTDGLEYFRKQGENIPITIYQNGNLIFLDFEGKLLLGDRDEVPEADVTRLGDGTILVMWNGKYFQLANGNVKELTDSDYQQLLATPEATAEATAEPTQPATATITPSPTNTPTVPPTSTPEPTDVPTATQTATLTPTPTDLAPTEVPPTTEGIVWPTSYFFIPPTDWPSWANGETKLDLLPSESTLNLPNALNALNALYNDGDDYNAAGFASNLLNKAYTGPKSLAILDQRSNSDEQSGFISNGTTPIGNVGGDYQVLALLFRNANPNLGLVVEEIVQAAIYNNILANFAENDQIYAGLGLKTINDVIDSLGGYPEGQGRLRTVAEAMQIAVIYEANVSSGYVANSNYDFQTIANQTNSTPAGLNTYSGVNALVTQWKSNVFDLLTTEQMQALGVSTDSTNTDFVKLLLNPAKYTELEGYLAGLGQFEGDTIHAFELIAMTRGQSGGTDDTVVEVGNISGGSAPTAFAGAKAQVAGSAEITATNTATPTLTNTPSATPTVTSTPSPTNTITPAPTNTPSETPTATLTNTLAPTLEPTSVPGDDTRVVPTVTASATLTPTDVPSATPTNTPVLPTATNTLIPPTSTLTVPPTVTLAPSATPTATTTPTSTFTAVPTNIPTATVTQTAMPTSTAEPSATPTATVTNTVVPTITATQEPTNLVIPTAATSGLTDSATEDAISDSSRRINENGIYIVLESNTQIPANATYYSDNNIGVNSWAAISEERRTLVRNLISVYELLFSIPGQVDQAKQSEVLSRLNIDEQRISEDTLIKVAIGMMQSNKSLDSLMPEDILAIDPSAYGGLKNSIVTGQELIGLSEEDQTINVVGFEVGQVYQQSLSEMNTTGGFSTLEYNSDSVSTVGNYDPDFPPFKISELSVVESQVNWFYREIGIHSSPKYVMHFDYERSIGFLLEKGANGDYVVKLQFPAGLASPATRSNWDFLTDFRVARVEGVIEEPNSEVFGSYLINLPGSEEIHDGSNGGADILIQKQNTSRGCPTLDRSTIAFLKSRFPGIGNTSDKSLDVIVAPNSTINLTDFFDLNGNNYITGSYRSAGEYYNTREFPPSPGEQLKRGHDIQVYFHPGVEEVERSGPVEVNYRPFLESYDTVVTVNIYDGTLTVFSVADDGSTEAIYSAKVLVGERIPNSQALANAYAASTFAADGSYFDAEKGIYYDASGVPRTTLTPPMLAELDGFLAIDGFGGESLKGVQTDTALIRAITVGGISDTNSEYTFHVVPPKNSSHYEQRRESLSLANQGEGYDPYWSHGCVNIHPDQWAELKALLQRFLSDGKRVGVVFGYVGFNQNLLVKPVGFDGRSDPLFANNSQRWVDSGLFYSRFNNLQLTVASMTSN